ncbi:MAG: glycosyltransferase family 39 protein [Chloroflexi bacterium]|nr:glycosyltransferase family 39 protein [Chloroflexota bacterium]
MAQLTAPDLGIGKKRRPSSRVSLGWLRSESTLVLLAGLVLYSFMVWLVVFRLNLFVTDGMARTIAAWRVFFGPDPKLSEIGFIWAPLPTLLQLPLVLVPVLQEKGLSGNVLTAIMGAFTLGSLNRIFRGYGLSRQVRYTLLALFAINPMILFYSSNALSEMTFIFFTLLSVDYLLGWHRTRAIRPLISLGFAVGLALLARYDTAVHAWLLLPVLYLLIHERVAKPSEAQALLVTYFAPVCFFGGLWVLFNLMIMGDPLYFARGAYSNTAQIGYQMALLSNIARLTGNPVEIAKFMSQQITELFPIFSVALVGLFVDAARTRHRLSLSVALLALSFPAFQTLNFLTGQSAAFLRYFILAIPYGYWMAAHLIARLAPGSNRSAVTAVLVVGLALSNVSSGFAMLHATEWGQWNDTFIKAMLNQERINTFYEEREIANFLLANVKGQEVLVDAFQGYRIMFFTENMMMWHANGDDDYDEVLKNPFGKVRYILVYRPQLETALNRVNKSFPTLYEHGAEWAELRGDWPIQGWRLYEIKPGVVIPQVAG